MNDFSAGEISKLLAGRVDSPIYAKGAFELTNFIPGRLGGAYRRGGLRYIADTPSASDKTRLIPWSVNDDLDLLVVMTDGAITLFNASSGTVHGYIVADGIPITILGGTVAAYAEADIFDVKYAQNINEIVFVHRDYPVFKIKIIDYDTTTLTLSLEYGLVGFEGNIAYSPELIAEELSNTDPFPSSTLVSYLNALASDESYEASGILNGKYVESVIKNKSTVARSAVIGTTNWFGQSVDATINDGAINIPVPSAFDGDLDVYVRYASGSGLIKKWTDNAPTRTDFLDTIARSMSDGDSFYMEYDDESFLNINPKSKGTVTFFSGGTSYTYTITFTDDSTLTIDPHDNVTLNGYFEMTYPDIEINKNSVTGTKLMDRINAWMTPEVAYPCDSATQFCGGYPLAATRYKGGRVYDQAGDLISEDDPHVAVDMMDGTTIIVKRDDTGLSGQLGVIVTPFYRSGDNPSVIAYHQGRLVLGGARREPNVLYMSKAGDTSNFCYFEEVEFEATMVTGQDAEGAPVYTTRRDITQQVGADAAIRIQLATEENEEIRSLTSVSDLIVQTATSEWVIPYGVTALNPQVILRGRLGASSVQSRFVGDSVFSASRTGRQIRAFSPRDGSGQNVTEHAEHIAVSGVTSLDFRQDPEQEIIAALDNGTILIGKVTPDIVAWSRVRTRNGDLIESAVCLSAYDEDAIYCVVKRTINGIEGRCIERLATPDEDTFAERVYLDRFVSGTTSGTGVASGLAAFYDDDSVRMITSSGQYGMPVIAGDGTTSTMILQSDIDAGITPLVPVDIDNDVDYHVGFPYTSRIETNRVDSPETEGLEKSVGFIYLRLYKSGDVRILRYRDDGELDYDVNVAVPVDSDGDRIYPYSGSVKFDHPGATRPDQTVIIEARGAESAGIQVIAPSYSVDSIG